MLIPGIGPAAAAALIAWMGEPGAIGDRQAAGGRRRPRNVLCMAAMAACQFNPEMAELHARLVARGKHRKVAAAAVMRRLIAVANALLRDRRTWQDRTAAAAG